MATQEELAGWIYQNQDKRNTREFQIVADAYRHLRQQQGPSQSVLNADREAMRKEMDPTKDMSTRQRLVAGYGKAGADMARGAGQWVGAVDRNDVAESRRLDAPLMDTTAGKVGNVAGTVAPLAATAALPFANTILGGTALGAVTGAIQPSTSTDETVRNIGLGAGGGAVVPAAVKTYQVGKAAAEPFYESGRNAIIGRALNAAAGKDAPEVANRLREVSAPFVGPSQGTPRTIMGEYVPGSIPTVGQAAENAGIASLESAAVATNPAVTTAVDKIAKAQNSARVGTLQDMAGSDGRRLFMSEARDATANQLYGEAKRLGIDPAVLTPQVQANIASLGQRVPPEVLNYAKKLAKISGETMNNASSIQGMHWVKKALDGMIGKAGTAGDAEMKRALTGLQKDLLSGMDKLSPAYENARKTYAAMSRPINQMDVAGEVIDKSVSKLNGNLQPLSYAKAVQSDATAARATGFPGATMEGTMEPAQMNALQSVLLDVRRATDASGAGRGAGSDTVRKLAYSNILDQSGVPTVIRAFSPAQVVGNVMSRGADAAYGRANRELANKLAEVMLDPGQAARLMTQATPQELNALLRLTGTGASGLAIAAPAATNAMQQ